MQTATAQTINGVDTIRLAETVKLIKSDSTLAKFQFRCRNHWNTAGHNTSAIQDFYGAGAEDTTRTSAFIVEADEPSLSARYGLRRQSGGVSAACARRMHDDEHGLSRGSARHSDQLGSVHASGRHRSSRLPGARSFGSQGLSGDTGGLRRAKRRDGRHACRTGAVLAGAGQPYEPCPGVARNPENDRRSSGRKVSLGRADTPRFVKYRPDAGC